MNGSQRDSLLQQSESWMVESSRLLDGVVLKVGAKYEVAASLLDLSTEHGQSIHVLVATGQLASAAALMRPQLESCMRGVWLAAQDISHDVAVSYCGASAEFPRISEVKTAIESQTLRPVVLLLTTAYDGIKALHDFAHGGCRQLGRRLGGGYIGRRAQPEWSASVLSWSCALSLTANLALAELSEDPTFVAAVSDLYSKYGILPDQFASEST